MSRKEAEHYYISDPASHLQSMSVKDYDVSNPLDIASMRKGNRKTKRFLESMGQSFEHYPERYFVESDEG